MNTASRTALAEIRSLVRESAEEARGEEMERDELRYFVEAVSSRLRIIEEEAFGTSDHVAVEEGA